MNIDQEKLAVVIEHMVDEVWGYENASDLVTLWDTDDLNTVIQELLGASVDSPFELPAGAAAVVYYITDGYGDGFIFALRPSAWSNHPLITVQVASLYEEARGYEPHGKIAAESVVRQIAEDVAYTLDALVPAYNKLFTPSCDPSGEVELH